MFIQSFKFLRSHPKFPSIMTLIVVLSSVIVNIYTGPIIPLIFARRFAQKLSANSPRAEQLEQMDIAHRELLDQLHKQEVVEQNQWRKSRSLFSGRGSSKNQKKPAKEHSLHKRPSQLDTKELSASLRDSIAKGISLAQDLTPDDVGEFNKYDKYEEKEAQAEKSSHEGQSSSRGGRDSFDYDRYEAEFLEKYVDGYYLHDRCDTPTFRNNAKRVVETDTGSDSASSSPRSGKSGKSLAAKIRDDDTWHPDDPEFASDPEMHRIATDAYKAMKDADEAWRDWQEESERTNWRTAAREMYLDRKGEQEVDDADEEKKEGGTLVKESQIRSPSNMKKSVKPRVKISTDPILQANGERETPRQDYYLIKNVPQYIEASETTHSENGRYTAKKIEKVRRNSTVFKGDYEATVNVFVDSILDVTSCQANQDCYVLDNTLETILDPESGEIITVDAAPIIDRPTAGAIFYAISDFDTPKIENCLDEPRFGILQPRIEKLEILQLHREIKVAPGVDDAALVGKFYVEREELVRFLKFEIDEVASYQYDKVGKVMLEL